jgi:hypothetical protein
MPLQTTDIVARHSRGLPCVFGAGGKSQVMQELLLGPMFLRLLGRAFDAHVASRRRSSLSLPPAAIVGCHAGIPAALLTNFGV